MRLSPRYDIAGGASDFWAYVRRPTPGRWPALMMALLCTSMLLFWVIREEVLSPPEPPKVSLIRKLAGERTEAEIIASNIANQKRRERLAAEQAQRDEEVKELYRQLGRATGIDVDAMERKIAADKLEEAARVKAQAQGGGAVAPATR